MIEPMECSSCNAYLYPDAGNRNATHEHWHDYIEERFGDLEREVAHLQAIISNLAPGSVGED